MSVCIYACMCMDMYVCMCMYACMRIFRPECRSYTSTDFDAEGCTHVYYEYRKNCSVMRTHLSGAVITRSLSNLFTRRMS